MKKLFSNYIFVLLNQIISMLVTFVTTPYISRVLQPEGIGQNAYVTSIVQLFTMFCLLSIPTYGAREIAIHKNDQKETAKIFFSIYSLQVILSCLVLVAYLAFLVFFKSGHVLFLINIVIVLSSMLDISWYFFGKEEAKKIVFRNVSMRILGVVCIFIFVNTPEDLALYVFILALSAFLGQLVMWIPLLKEVKFEQLERLEVKRHLNPIIVLFFPQLAILIYGNLNNVILGFLSGDVELGFYNQAYNTVFLILGIISSLSTVMLPRMAHEFSEGNMESVKRYVKHVLQFVLFISIPMMFGLIGIAPNFVQWFFGPDFEPVGVLLMIISCKVLLVGLANVFGIQVLVATHQQNKFTISVTMGALSSVMINVLLANALGSIATALALVTAEIVGVLFQMYFTRKYYELSYFVKELVKYLIVGAMMYGVIMLATSLVNLSMMLLSIFQIGLGTVVYIGVLWMIRDSFIKKLGDMIKNRKFS